MDVRIAPARWGARALVVGLTTSMLAIGVSAFAQQPPATQSPAAPPLPQLTYSPWTKLCFKEQGGQQICFTGKEGKVESGITVVEAVLLESEGQAKKLLRVVLPLGIQLAPGMRVIVDQGPPISAPYTICLAYGCIADYEASEELIGNMKKGQGLVVQGINNQGETISLALPLNDFGKAYDGPPTDPKVYEELQKKLQDDLQKRAEEARKKLGGEQSSPR